MRGSPGGRSNDPAGLGPPLPPPGAPRSEDLARASYLAIRQPAVVHLLEGRLTTVDGDALAAGLDLACQVLEQTELADGAAPPRLEHTLLDRGVAAIETGACDAGLTAWVTRALEELPLVLTAAEERRVAGTVAAIVWALAEVRAAGVGDDVLS